MCCRADEHIALGIADEQAVAYAAGDVPDICSHVGGRGHFGNGKFERAVVRLLPGAAMFSRPREMPFNTCQASAVTPIDTVVTLTHRENSL